MARSRPKEKLLPSLLDRLTDDDPTNRSIKVVKEKIKQLEKQLIQLKKSSNTRDPEQFREEQDYLLQQLEGQRFEHSRLSDSMSSLSEIRQCVKRDLDWLLNSHNFKPQDDLDEYPEIKTSVLNYGLPDLAGMTISSIDRRTLEKLIKQALLSYEPRIIRRSLRVNLLADTTAMEHNTLNFEIVGDLVAEPSPIHLHLLTQLELENGDMVIQEYVKTGE